MPILYEGAGTGGYAYDDVSQCWRRWADGSARTYAKCDTCGVEQDVTGFDYNGERLECLYGLQGWALGEWGYNGSVHCPKHLPAWVVAAWEEGDDSDISGEGCHHG